MLHSRVALDVDSRDDNAVDHWKVRPIAVRRDDDDRLRPVGHFETLICLGCGLSRWYAFDWHDAVGKDLRARCDECDDETPQRHMSAVENAAGGFEQPPLTRGWLSHEGRLFITLCRRCDRVRWSAKEHEQLDRHFFVHYVLRKELDRRCLACGSSDALLDPNATEVDGSTIPIAVCPPHVEHDQPLRIGSYTIRLCRACAAVEWYANDPSRLAANEAAQLVHVGATAKSSTHGPYR